MVLLLLNDHTIGQHHGCFIHFCGCTSVVERLVELRFWPATPQSPKLVFTMELMDTVHAATLECHVSLLHAYNMLRSLSVIQAMVSVSCVYVIVLE